MVKVQIPFIKLRGTFARIIAHYSWKSTFLAQSIQY